MTHRRVVLVSGSVTSATESALLCTESSTAELSTWLAIWLLWCGSWRCIHMVSATRMAMAAAANAGPRIIQPRSRSLHQVRSRWVSDGTRASSRGEMPAQIWPRSTSSTSAEMCDATVSCRRSSWRNSPSHSRQRVLCSATPRIWRGSSWPSKTSGSSGRVSRQFIDALAARRHRRCRSRFPARSGSQAIPQLVLELLPRVVQAAHDGALGALHDTADIVVGESFDFAKKYDGFVIGGQLADRLLHAFADLARARLLVRIAQPLVGQGRFEILAAAGTIGQRHRPMALVAAPKVDAQIHYDSIQPCIEARLALEAVEIFVRLDEGLLRELERIVAVVDHAHCHGEDLALVAL